MGCIVNRAIQDCIGTVHEIGHMDGVIRRKTTVLRSLKEA